MFEDGILNISNGVEYVQTRPAAMAALDPMGLAGQGGVVSESTPGIFIQVNKVILYYFNKD